VPVLASLAAARWDPVIARLAARLTFGLSSVLSTGFQAGLEAGLGPGLSVGLGVGLAIGVAALRWGEAQPSRGIRRRVTAGSRRRNDRRGRRRAGGRLPHGLPYGIAAAPLAYALVGILSGLAYGLVISTLRTAWPSYVLARTWLAWRRRLPWSLTAFLADAHRRGVLRQAGTVYQFRHRELQRRLASRP
jgi:hypothetical protein